MNHQCFAPKIAKVMAFKWTIRLAQELSLQNIIFETDCQEFSLAWKEGSVDRCTYFDDILQDYKYLLGYRSNSTLVYTRRTRYIVANHLGRIAFSYANLVYIEDFPS